MVDPKPPPPRRRIPHLAATVADPVLTDKLAKRVRRDVDLETAEKAAANAEGTGDHPAQGVKVVLGPDGVPQLADDPEVAPETVRADSERLAKMMPKKK